MNKIIGIHYNQPFFSFCHFQPPSPGTTCSTTTTTATCSTGASRSAPQWPPCSASAFTPHSRSFAPANSNATKSTRTSSPSRLLATWCCATYPACCGRVSRRSSPGSDASRWSYSCANTMSGWRPIDTECWCCCPAFRMPTSL